MADAPPDRPVQKGRLAIRIAQLLLVVSAAGLWTASRLPWVTVQSFDGLSPAKDVTLTGGSWSTALLPLALLMLASAVAALAVRGVPLRVLAVLLAAASFAIAYLGVSLWVLPDVALRGADLAHVSLLTLVGSQRHYGGSVAAVLSAVCTLAAVVLLLRSASIPGSDRETTTKYAAPAARRSLVRQDREDGADAAAPEVSERMLWDALDEGRDPTDRPRDSDSEGR
jgi:uncharacterized membrane protein (TIGR02234 family)